MHSDIENLTALKITVLLGFLSARDRSLSNNQSVLVSARESVERVLLGGDPSSVLRSRRLAPDHGASDGGVVGVDEEGDRLPDGIFFSGVIMRVCLFCITGRAQEVA